MAAGTGWYLVAPLVAVAVTGALGAAFWRLGSPPPPSRDLDGLAILDALDGPDDAPAPAPEADYGLLIPAAVADGPADADRVRGLLAAAGIRATGAPRPDGRVLVLVFADRVDEARRLLGGSPAV